jgi:hypothetical protein
MPKRNDAQFLRVLRRQARKDALVNFVLAEGSLILPKTKASEPASDIQWSRAAVGHGA